MTFLSEKTHKGGEAFFQDFKGAEEYGGIETICLSGHQGWWWSQWCNQPTYFKQILKSKEAENENDLQDKLFGNCHVDIPGGFILCNTTRRGCKPERISERLPL